jgi:integrase
MALRNGHGTGAPGKWIKSSPIPRGWLPRAGDEKAKECLYPDEERRLLECTDVPLPRRLAYGFLTREGMRTDELARLTWADVDLVHNRVDLDEKKTDKPPSWDMRPDVLAAVASWRKHLRKDAETSDRVFADDDGMGLNVDHLATQLRDERYLADVRPHFSRRRLRSTRRPAGTRRSGSRGRTANRPWEAAGS